MDSVERMEGIYHVLHYKRLIQELSDLRAKRDDLEWGLMRVRDRLKKHDDPYGHVPWEPKALLEPKRDFLTQSVQRLNKDIERLEKELLWLRSRILRKPFLSLPKCDLPQCGECGLEKTIAARGLCWACYRRQRRAEIAASPT